MKEDYLWDKTGSDSEIENIENALKMFRDQNQMPPRLPAKTYVLENEKAVELAIWSRIFSFGAISFACLALAIFSFGVFRLLSVEQGEVADTIPTASSATAKAAKFGSDDQTIAKTSVETEEPIKPKQPSNFRPQQVSRVRRKNKVRSRSSRRRVKKSKVTVKPETLVLTEEEKHAYNQLMLALNITSSNLKLVKDKVQGD